MEATSHNVMVQVKSRMMGDSSAYKNTLDCFVKTLKNDVSLSFFHHVLLHFPSPTVLIIMHGECYHVGKCSVLEDLFFL